MWCCDDGVVKRKDFVVMWCCEMMLWCCDEVVVLWGGCGGTVVMWCGGIVAVWW